MILWLVNTHWQEQNAKLGVLAPWGVHVCKTSPNNHISLVRGWATMCCLCSIVALILWLVKQGLGTEVLFHSLLVLGRAWRAQGRAALAGSPHVAPCWPAPPARLHPRAQENKSHGPPAHPSSLWAAAGCWLLNTSLEGLGHWAITWCPGAAFLRFPACTDHRAHNRVYYSSGSSVTSLCYLIEDSFSHMEVSRRADVLNKGTVLKSL